MPYTMPSVSTIVLMSIATLCSFSATAAQHPMDPLSPEEIKATVKILKDSEVASSRTRYPFIRLHEMSKAKVIGWKTGGKITRRAEAYTWLEGELLRHIVDLDRSKILETIAITEGQPAFQAQEFLTLSNLVHSNKEWQEAIAKRGITDFRKVLVLPFSTGYFGDPSEHERRIYRIGSYYPDNIRNYWGRQIGGLTVLVDMTNRAVIKIIDTGAVPLPDGNEDFDAESMSTIRETPNPILYTQDGGASFTIDGNVVKWQNWSLHYRIEPHVGLILSNITYNDNGTPRSVLYQASLSELFVPYMDPSEHWYFRTFIDAGEYGIGHSLTPLIPGEDCPKNARVLDVVLAGVTGRPQTFRNALAIFERYNGDPMWRHVDVVSQQAESRRAQELVLRTVATVGNYDYLFDWVFRQDGAITVRVGATGICSAKSVASRTAAEDLSGRDGRYGRFVAPNTIAVNHDHYLIYRLDFDVDGTKNNLIRSALKKVRFENSPRSSGWVVESKVVRSESDARMRVSLTNPAMWRITSATEKNEWGYPTSYHVKPAATAISLMDPDDWSQRRGAFSEFNFYVTPYSPNERHAAGDFPNQSEVQNGIASWTAQNRNIENQDIVAWYSVGFHHIVRAEDWPVMPTVWHEFTLRPFDFFDRNPAINLPRQQSD